MKNIKIMIECYDGNKMYPTLNEHIKAVEATEEDGIRHVNAMWGNNITMTFSIGTVVDDDGEVCLMGGVLMDWGWYHGTFDGSNRLALVKGHMTDGENATSYCVVKTIMDELTRGNAVTVSAGGETNVGITGNVTSE